jgi:tRNA C32,U32 (ribose-2'-O)-methylase TrmJ
MILCHELFSAVRETSICPVPRLAGRHELNLMYDELEVFFNTNSFEKPGKTDYWLNHLRRFFNRFELRAREVWVIRTMIQHFSKRVR